MRNQTLIRRVSLEEVLRRGKQREARASSSRSSTGEQSSVGRRERAGFRNDGNAISEETAVTVERRAPGLSKQRHEETEALKGTQHRKRRTRLQAGNDETDHSLLRNVCRMLEDRQFAEVVSWGYHGDTFVVKVRDLCRRSWSRT